jgi:hypothetical protein
VSSGNKCLTLRGGSRAADTADGPAFWTAGQFFIFKAYLLLVFAGIWALMEGITDVVRAFGIRELHEEV